MTHLRTMMIEELVRRNYSAATRECYIRAVEAFARYVNCRPVRLGLEGVRIFQAHLFTLKRATLPMTEEFPDFRGVMRR